MKRLFCALALATLVACPAVAAVVHEETSWINPADNTEVPAHIFYDAAQARSDGTLPAVLFIHARRGIQEPDKKYIAEIAAGGFLILAPDWQTGRFIEHWPVPHDPATERDVAIGLERLKTMPRVRPNERRILYGYSRGGYYAVRLASGALDAAHRDQIACLVTIAGHFQSPNAPEAAQVYGLMPELDRLTQPLLMIIGTEDTGLRVDNNARAFYSLVERSHRVELVLLPQARRAFDFREYVEGSTFTPSEKVAKRYAMGRAREFMQECLR